MPNTTQLHPPAPNEVHRTSPTCVEPYLYVQAVIYRETPPFNAWPSEYVVGFLWTDTREALDRPETHRISCGQNLQLAKRLASATEAGRVHEAAEILTDVDGRTYVQSSATVMGKRLNADLTRMGF